MSKNPLEIPRRLAAMIEASAPPSRSAQRRDDLPATTGETQRDASRPDEIGIRVPQNVYDLATAEHATVARHINGQEFSGEMSNRLATAFVQILDRTQRYLIREEGKPKSQDERLVDVLFAAADLIDQLNVSEPARMRLRIHAEQRRDRLRGIEPDASNAVWCFRGSVVGAALAIESELGRWAESRRLVVGRISETMGGGQIGLSKLAPYFPARDRQGRTPDEMTQRKTDPDRMAELIDSWAKAFKTGKAGPKGDKGSTARRHYAHVISDNATVPAREAFEAHCQFACWLIRESPTLA